MATLFEVKPKLEVLTLDQMDQIHAYSLKLLETTGVRVDSERARLMFAKAVGQNMIGGNRVRIPRETVQWALRAAPPTVEIFDRRGKLAFTLGNDRTRFGIGVTVLYYQDAEDGNVTKFTRRHMEESVRLGHTLPLFDVISTVGIVQDMPADVADYYATLEMVANSSKPLVLLISDEKLFAGALDLLEHLCGDLAARPFLIPYFNPITPLVMNESTTDKMLETIDRGVPLIYSNYSMAGVSSPITPAGNLALLNAELLAGLTLSQLAREGAPIILGSLPNFFDMKTMVSFYDPLSILMSLSCAEMMAYYRLPHCGTSGGAMGWGGDLMASGTYWMNQLTSCIGRSGLAPFIGDTLGAKAFSPANVVYAHEVIAQSLHFSEGFALDDESVALNEIDRVGPGGNFLRSKQTLKHYRAAYYTSPIFPRWSMETWLSHDRPKPDKLLSEYTKDLLSRLEVPEDHDELIRKGERFIQHHLAG